MNYSLLKTIEKGVRGLMVGAVVAISAFYANKMNVELTAQNQEAMIVGFSALGLGVVSFLTNLLKHKFPKLFGWL